MRGRPQAQPDFLTVIHLNACVPADHPLRGIKRRVDAVLKRRSTLFDELYEAMGRPSIPPEQLRKARVLTALYTIRSERLFCEQLGYNLLWLWFLDREFSEGSFDHSIFAKNYERVLSADVAKLFFAEVYDRSRPEGWTSDTHFTADGTLIESWASLKSFVRRDGGDAQKVQAAKDDDPGNPSVDFRGEKRRNATHQSTTDPKGYHRRDFVSGCRERAIAPHVACKEGVQVPGLDGRTTQRSGCQTSLRIRKRVEEIFGWIKTVGGLRRSRYRGRERTQAWGYFVAGTYNLLRMARLELATAT